MKITVLDAGTLGEDLSLNPLSELGLCYIYASTLPEQVAERICESDVVILNKIKLNESNLKNAKKLKLICVAATGYDNIDVDYCRANNIGVCNVEGYSSNSVAQITVAMVLTLSAYLREYTEFVKSGAYTESGMANRLIPAYNEISGMTWGIVGLGNIGKKVARVAEAFDCRVIACKRTPEDGYECTDIDTLCKESDIITIHTPLNDNTKNLVSAERIDMMKRNAIVVNAARGAVIDENAMAEALKKNKIGAFGTDVYSVEPFSKEHPFWSIKGMTNVCLTPHMAWGAYEARVRCLCEIIENIKSFCAGGIRNRVDL